MQHGRRAQYRVSVDDIADLRVALLGPDGSPCSGRLLDLSASGAGIRFTGRSLPSLAVGQEVDLVFTSEKLRTPMTVAAKVQHRTEEQGARRFGFRFLEAQALDTELPPVMRELFNRRRTVRVVPDPRRPVTVELRTEPEAPPLEVGLVNISETGVAISLDVGQDSRFADTTTLLVTLYLPDSRRPVSLMGDIRYRRLMADRIHYGIDFDPEASRDFERKQATITKYVLKRQLKTLRQSA
ncbi:MAG: PilZ domain-containing protein [Planctomycetota bacterium]|jgi:c-di-GMP-binding flagellar brake protein YcgR